MPIISTPPPKVENVEPPPDFENFFPGYHMEISMKYEEVCGKSYSYYEDICGSGIWKSEVRAVIYTFLFI